MKPQTEGRVIIFRAEIRNLCVPTNWKPTRKTKQALIEVCFFIILRVVREGGRIDGLYYLVPWYTDGRDVASTDLHGARLDAHNFAF